MISLLINYQLAENESSNAFINYKLVVIFSVKEDAHLLVQAFKRDDLMLLKKNHTSQ